jgi:stress response protein SCP2
VRLVKGANTALSATSLLVKVTWRTGGAVSDVDTAVLLLDKDRQVTSDDDLVFYNQPSHPSGAATLAVKTRLGGGGQEVLDLDIGRLPTQVQRVVVAASAEGGSFSDVPHLWITVVDVGTGSVLADYSVEGATTETVMVLGEVYRHNGLWKFRAVGQGHSEGLARLVAGHGVQVDDAPEEAAVVQEVIEPSVPVASTGKTSSARRGKSLKDLWVPAGEPVQVGDASHGGVLVTGGMVYIGTLLKDDRWGGSWYDERRVLIDPALSVRPAKSSRTDHDLGYMPSYQGLTPKERGYYLSWLSSGRCDPDTPDGYLFLYFYGLEHRLLEIWQPGKGADTEAQVLLDELSRLAESYSNRHSFPGYVRRLLSFLNSRTGGVRYEGAPPATKTFGWEGTPEIRIGLGQLARAAKPVPAAWAEALWSVSDLAQPRTARKRCPEEFSALFAALYAEEFGEGILLQPGSKRLVRTYQPAFPGLDAREVKCGVPDVGDLAEEVAALSALAEEATNSLDAYSRFVGRRPDEKESPAALALLPWQLHREDSAQARALTAWAEGVLGAKDVALAEGSELLSSWSAEASLGKVEATSMATFLERCGFGVAPDVRLGEAAPKAGKPVVLFRTASSVGPEEEPPAGLASVLALAALASPRTVPVPALRAVSEVVGKVDEDDADLVLLQRQIQARQLLTQQRSPSAASLRKLAQDTDPAQQRVLPTLLADLACSDGPADPERASAVARVFEALGRPATEAYSELHARSARRLPVPAGPTQEDHLAPARTSGAPGATFRVPPRPGSTPEDVTDLLGVSTAQEVASPADGFTLDLTRVAQTQSDSDRVSSLLAEIFVEEEVAVPAAAPATASQEEDLVEGLDGAHSSLLRALAARGEWSRADAVALSEGFGLMLDGALDLINEASLDLTGELVSSGTDPICIDPETLEELL